MLLDGGAYAFIYSLAACCGAWVVGLAKFKDIQRVLQKRERGFTVLCILIFFCLVSVKAVPSLLIAQFRPVSSFDAVFGWRPVFFSLLDTFQLPRMVHATVGNIEVGDYFHEYGCYSGGSDYWFCCGSWLVQVFSSVSALLSSLRFFSFGWRMEQEDPLIRGLSTKKFRFLDLQTFKWEIASWVFCFSCCY